MQVLVWAQHVLVWRQWRQGSQVLEQSRGCCKLMLIPCFSGSCRETCSTWETLWAFAPVVFPLDAGGVWETLWSAPQISAEQKAELPVPRLHCSATLGCGEALPH